MVSSGGATWWCNKNHPTGALYPQCPCGFSSRGLFGLVWRKARTSAMFTWEFSIQPTPQLMQSLFGSGVGMGASFSKHWNPNPHPGQQLDIMHPQSTPQGGWECHYKVIVLGQLEPNGQHVPALLSAEIPLAFLSRHMLCSCETWPSSAPHSWCNRYFAVVAEWALPCQSIKIPTCTLGSSWTLCLCSHRLVDHLLQTHSWSCINAIRKCSSKNLRVRKPSFVGFVPGLTGRNFGEVAMLSSCSNSVTAASNALVALFDLVLSASTL